MLLQYKDNFTSKPGKCKDFEYRFEVARSGPKVGRTRPSLFLTVRRANSEQMLDEYSNSCQLNPLTILLRDGKSPRTCADTRRVNQLTMPDHVRVPPIQELLQQFHGSVYMTSMDLSSEFLQVGLHPESRKYIAFLFESQVYQFTRTPYGFGNSLSAFVRGLQSTLSSDTCG
jgi:hypothetical protein